MARPTVRIHPPKAGDEDWLASMIAPLLDVDSSKLSRAFSKGAVSVGAGLNGAEADELVDVLNGFGAQAERVNASPRRTGQPLALPALRGRQTEPFDAGLLRSALGEGTQSTGPVRRARPRTGRPADPERRERLTGATARRTTGRTSGVIPPRTSRPVRAPAPRTSGPVRAPAPRTSRPVRLAAPRTSGPVPAPRTSGPTRAPAPRSDPPPSRRASKGLRTAPGPTRGAGPMPMRRASTPLSAPVRSTGPTASRPERRTGPASTPPARKSGAVPSRPSTPPARKSRPVSERPAGRPSGGLGRVTQPGEPSRLAPELASPISKGPAHKEPPWFPQVPIRPGEAVEEQESGLSWWWILLIMGTAGIVAWWIQTQ